MNVLPSCSRSTPDPVFPVYLPTVELENAYELKDFLGVFCWSEQQFSSILQGSPRPISDPGHAAGKFERHPETNLAGLSVPITIAGFKVFTGIFSVRVYNEVCDDS